MLDFIRRSIRDLADGLGWNEVVIDGEIDGDEKEERFFKEMIIRNEGLRSKTICGDSTYTDDELLWHNVLADINVLRYWNDSIGNERVKFGRRLENGEIIWLCITPYTNGKTKIVALAGTRVANCTLKCTQTNTSIKMGDTLYSWTHEIKNIKKDVTICRTVSSEVTTIEKTDWGTINTRRVQFFRNGVEVQTMNSKETTLEVDKGDRETEKNAQNYKIEVCKSVTIEQSIHGISKLNRKSLFKNGKEVSVIFTKESPSDTSPNNKISDISIKTSKGKGIPIPGKENTEWSSSASSLPSSTTSSLSSDESFTYKTRTPTKRPWFSNVIGRNLDAL